MSPAEFAARLPAAAQRDLVEWGPNQSLIGIVPRSLGWTAPSSKTPAFNQRRIKLSALSSIESVIRAWSPDFDGQPDLTLPVAAEAVEPGYRKLVEELPAGITYFALHCTAPGDVAAITPQHAP
jgi:hypothetical protein